MRLILGAFLLAILCGCVSHHDFGGAPNLTMIPAAELPAPTGIADTPPLADYRIAPQDKLTISVFGLPDLTQKEIVVDNGGRVAFPLAGIVNAAGLTTAQLADEVAARLRTKYVRDPKVTVNVTEASGHLVTVDGAVQMPGLYPAVPNMTLMQAIASARGTSDTARTKDVVVFRDSGGRRYAALYQLDAIRRGNYDDPRIYANDTIVVGESSAKRLFDRLIQLAPLLTTPLIVYFQNH